MALCALNGCDERAAKLARYCSLACAESEIKALRKRIRESKSRFSADEIKASGYGGEASPAALRGLRNPFAERSAAHVAFHVLRDASFHDGVNREEFISRLEEACLARNIPLHSPRARVKRVMTDIRARGFELVKDDAGRFRLTGRRVDPAVNRCRDCEHWDDTFGGGLRGPCDNAKLSQFEDDHDADGLAFEVAPTAMYFGPEFGCVHWGARNKEDNCDV